MGIDFCIRTIAVFDTGLPEFEKYLKTGHYAYAVISNKIYVFNISYEEAVLKTEIFHLENMKFVKVDELPTYEFNNELTESYKKIISRMKEIGLTYHIENLINESMDMNFTGYHRYICRCKLYGK